MLLVGVSTEEPLNGRINAYPECCRSRDKSRTDCRVGRSLPPRPSGATSNDTNSSTSPNSAGLVDVVAPLGADTDIASGRIDSDGVKSGAARRVVTEVVLL